MCHHTRLILVLIVELGFDHVAQADLELLTSSDPPASASQSAGITVVSYHAQSRGFFVFVFVFSNTKKSSLNFKSFFFVVIFREKKSWRVY